MKKFKIRCNVIFIFSILLYSISSCQSEQSPSESESVKTENQTEILKGEEELNSLDSEKSTKEMDSSTVSDEELESLAAINQKMRSARSQLSEDLKKFIADEGYSIEEFQRLARRSENELSSDQKATITRINDKMMEFQLRNDALMQRIVTEAGYTMEEFRKIGRRINTDPELRAKIER